MKLISTEVTWKCKCLRPIWTEAGLSLIPVCLCSALIGWFLSPSGGGGLKTVGWLKQITKGRVCWHHTLITTVMASSWKHRCILLLSLLVLHLQSSTCLDGQPADRWVRDWQTETEMMFYLVVVGFWPPWLFNLWLLTCSAQRLPMHFYCVVHQDLCFIGCVCHFFKAALSDLFYWVIWGQKNKLRTQHLTYNTLWQAVTYFHMQQTQINIIIPLKSCLCLPDDSPSNIHSPF